MGETKLTALVETKALQELTEHVEAAGLRRDTYLTRFIDYWVRSRERDDLRGSAENLRFWKASAKIWMQARSKLRITIDTDVLERLNTFCKDRQIHRDGAITTILWEAAERARNAYSVLYEDDISDLIDWTEVIRSQALCAMDSETAQLFEQTVAEFKPVLLKARMDELKAKRGLGK